jgi:hypothetical protein
MKNFEDASCNRSDLEDIQQGSMQNPLGQVFVLLWCILRDCYLVDRREDSIVIHPYEF